MKIYEYIDFLLDVDNAKSLAQMKKRNYPVKKAYELAKPYENTIFYVDDFKTIFEAGYELINNDADNVFEIMSELYEKFEQGSIMYGYTTVTKEEYKKEKKSKKKEKITETIIEMYISPEDDKLKGVFEKHFIVEEHGTMLILKKAKMN